ncbi:DUF4112 domain-containing protein [Thermocoleostomius sinensis]|uniref:DUF4112 domain-containing protein n=1 Tax=Thermocoleostomius sinensis A174 TaxID=2016057 RepID=A0A9E9CBC2_9CYAN|nr:DUF4112 domain-containing protein [Thermocoleostomius sinensis]WAL62132.1 DUF4112 domain-containing protein [Thermocoleostomius sinensis A174]
MPPSSPRPSAVPADSRVVRFQRLRRLSQILDNAIGIPGTRIRFGLDPIIGLIPGGGDTVGMIFSSAIVLEAARMGASKTLLGQMAFNILLETVAGIVPVVGDIFDVTWKSNVRNIVLLEKYLEIERSTRPQNRWFAVLLLIGLFLVFAACLTISVLVLRWLLQMLGTIAQ